MIDELDAVQTVGTTEQPDPDARARVRQAVDRRRGGASPRRRWPARVGLALGVAVPLAAGVAFVGVVGSDSGGERSAPTRQAPKPAPSRKPVLSLFPHAGQALRVRVDAHGLTCREAGATTSCAVSRSRSTRTLPEPATTFLGNERVTRAELLRLRLTGAELHARLRAGVQAGQGHGIEDEVFVQLTDALRDGPKPPALRAAIAAAFPLVGRVEQLGSVRDRRGRTAVGFAQLDSESGIRHEVLLDPGSSALLAERDVLVDAGRSGLASSGFANGDLVEDTVYYGYRLVDKP